MAHIALIDSGIGGFSILAEIEAKIPDAVISYFMDNLYLPYGELSESRLCARLERIVEFLLKQSRPDIVVIACNTAATQSLDFLRQRFDRVFVGVVPAIKSAALQSNTGQIALLATPATARGAYVNKLIRDFADGCKVQRVGSSELVHLAEQLFWQLHSHSDDDIRQIIAQATAGFEAVDTVVLGCTHFPLIKEMIQRELGNQVLLIDAAGAIAKHVASLLDCVAFRYSSAGSSKQLFSTQKLCSPKRQKLAAMGFGHIDHVSLENVPNQNPLLAVL